MTDVTVTDAIPDEGATPLRAERRLPQWRGAESVTPRDRRRHRLGLIAAALGGLLLLFALGPLGEALAVRVEPTALILVVGLAIACGAARVATCARRAAETLARSAEAACEDLEARLAARESLLERIAESQRSAISVVDGEGRYRFVNGVAASRAGLSREALLQRRMADVLPAEQVASCAARNAEVLAGGGRRKQWLRVPRERGDSVLMIEHLPLDPDKAVLMVEHDLTGEVVERERRRRGSDDLLRLVLGAIDQRDPLSAHHAAAVGELSAAIAEEMRLEDSLRETVRQAGTLMTVGKPLVPELLLTHDSGLTPDERRQAAASLEATLELLEGYDFELPVLETLEQLQERVDGRGWPQALRDEQISTGAKIVKVANSYLGLVDRRPGSPGHGSKDALSELLQNAGRLYDGGAVEALCRIMESATDPEPGQAVPPPEANRRPPQR